MKDIQQTRLAAAEALHNLICTHIPRDHPMLNLRSALPAVDALIHHAHSIASIATHPEAIKLAIQAARDAEARQRQLETDP